MIGTIHHPPLTLDVPLVDKKERLKQLFGKSMQLLSHLAVSIYQSPQFASSLTVASTAVMVFVPHPLEQKVDRFFEEGLSEGTPPKRKYQVLSQIAALIAGYCILSGSLLHLLSLSVDPFTLIAVTVACLASSLFLKESAKRAHDLKTLKSQEKQLQESRQALLQASCDAQAQLASKNEEIQRLDQELQAQKMKFSELTKELHYIKEAQALEKTNHALDLHRLTSKLKKQEEAHQHQVKLPEDSEIIFSKEIHQEKGETIETQKVIIHHGDPVTPADIQLLQEKNVSSPQAHSQLAAHADKSAAKKKGLQAVAQFLHWGSHTATDKTAKEGRPPEKKLKKTFSVPTLTHSAHNHSLL